ncbi:MAG: small subunit ribosomal protein S17 [Parcubacteria group bacterium Gr01-1014_33]|nr:MAG: small subunit ribosomal protein S17 [Parcubacteria group bacterium Gr01-1014_33]
MRKLKGTIVSDKMQKTVVVRVDQLKKHSKYGKYVRISRTLKAHDEKNEYKAGDTVLIQETRPLSKEKKWRVAELVKRASGEENGEEEGNESGITNQEAGKINRPTA